MTERMSDLAGAGVAKNALIYNDRKEQNIASISLSPMSELVTSLYVNLLIHFCNLIQIWQEKLHKKIK